MLKAGLMLTGDAEYDLYEIKAKNFYRFDIIKKGAEFHIDWNDVLFSRYKRKRLRRYGDATLYQKYIDTVVFLQKTQGELISKSGWVKEDFYPYNSNFYQTVLKGEAGSRLVTKIKNGKWYEEIYVHNGVTIIMRVAIENYKVALIPIDSFNFEYEGLNL